MCGDLKYLLQVFGREGLSSHHCLWCRMKAPEWKKIHAYKNSINYNTEPWEIDKLISQMLAPLSKGVDLPTGQKNLSLWDFIPIERTLFPILHILFGLVNNLTVSFFEWIYERAEPLLPDELSSRDLTMMAEIYVDEKQEEAEMVSDNLKNVTADKN